MKVAEKLDRLHFKVRQNKWHAYFAIFCRISLAAGFIPSGMQKVLGERFTVLAVNHPMGNFLEAFYHTGYYYTFVGLLQVLAAVLLLIPRTVTLGAFIYLPIILNICILSFAVRFDGSQITSPLMVLAVLYLLAWDYHKFKGIFPFKQSPSNSVLPQADELTNKFPSRFFAGVVAIVIFVAFHTRIFYDIMPRNTLSDCRNQCKNEDDTPCLDFCACIHKNGNSLDICFDKFDKKGE
ncbi:MAG: DoxX family protein [Bacteroidia bacterium]|nr:DoxX family protein [Bacteroidia bacterium]